jgi:hypothetical protein
MTKTFIEMKKGDLIYYVSIVKSSLKHEPKIISSEIVEINKTVKPYEIEIKLKNNVSFNVNNWNRNVYTEVNFEDVQTNSIAEPLTFSIYSPNKEMVKTELQETITNALTKLSTWTTEIQQEIIRLTFLKDISNKLEISENEKIILEPTFV